MSWDIHVVFFLLGEIVFVQVFNTGRRVHASCKNNKNIRGREDLQPGVL